MQRIAISAAVGLVLSLSGVSAAAEGASCGNHGTAVQFVDTPSEAAREAAREHKLVLVLHVSGLFEDPKLT